MVSSYYDDRINNNIYSGVNKNTFDFINEATQKFENYTALSYFKNEINYGEFKKKAMIYANKLKKYGLNKGDTISLLLPNVPEIVYYYYGAWILGVKINPIDPRFNPKGILDSVNNSNSKLLICILDKYKEKIMPIQDKLLVENIILVSPTDSMGYSVKELLAKGLYAYRELLLNNIDNVFASGKVLLNQKFIKNTQYSYISSVYEDNIIASNIFTSGTTGVPKAAQLTHRAFNIKANQIRYGVPNLDPGDSFLAIIPFFSAYGSFSGMHNCLHKAMNLILIPNFEPNEVSDLICKHRASAMIGVPKYWEDFLNNYDFIKNKYKIKDLSFLKNPVVGGDKINSAVVDECNKLFQINNSSAKLIIGYGSTETGGPIATTINDENYRDNENTGVLFPGVKYVFVNPETNEISSDFMTGELAINDPGMMIGYESVVETTNATVEYNGEKYFKTGDLFEINDKGMLYFKGRIKRAMMRPDGHTVHSLPIEKSINLSQYVKDNCVVGLKKKDNTSGTIPTAFVVLKNEYMPSEEITFEIDKICLENLSERNRALAYVYVNKLPYTLMEKIDYKALEQLYIDDLDYYIVDDTFISKKNSMCLEKK